MVKRQVSLMIGGLVLLVMLGSLALAQEPVSQRDWDVSTRISGAHVERRERLSLSERQVISRGVSIEPVRLQITESITVESRLTLTGHLLPKARVVERYHYPTASDDIVVNAVSRGGPRLLVPRELHLASEHLPRSQINETSRPTRSAGTCTVSSADDSGPNTLRECLQNAAAGDDVLFDPSVFPPENPQTITLSSELPPITVDNLTLDASNAGVILDGSGLTGDTDGLRVEGAEGVTIQGLQILNFEWGIVLGSATNCTIGGDRTVGAGPMGQGNMVSGNLNQGIQCSGTSNVIIGNFINDNGEAGIVLHGVGTTGNQILGNFIGTDLSGEVAVGNRYGVVLMNGASGNVIGGTHTTGACDDSCNLISGNLEMGVLLQHVGTTENQILGNFIGTNISGTAAIPNNHGIAIGVSASDTQVGGTGTGEGNLISGNTNMGVWISSAETTGNQVLGNTIGTDVAGVAPLPNYYGVYVTLSTNNQIGGATPGAGNLISGNDFIGVALQVIEAPGNTVAGNKIGSDASGTLAVPNYAGVSIAAASSNTIGGTASGSGNLISGNTYIGVSIEYTSTLNSLLGNLIGTDLAGSVALPNEGHGVSIGFGASNNTVGGSADGAGNLISGNGESGVQIQNKESIGNRVLGNRIGTNLSGSGPLPNGGDGVSVIEARETIIGGVHTPWVCDGSCNLISGNGEEGVHIQGKSADITGQTRPAPAHHSVTGSLADGQNNQVLGNFIGTDLSGSLAVPNENGVGLSNQAVGDVLGGSTPGAGNLVSGNRTDGIGVTDPGTTANRILGNRIGTTADGNAALANGRVGVSIISGAFGNTVGGRESSEGNLISGNSNYFGIQIQAHFEPGTNDNQIIGNRIGTNWDGTVAIPNLGGVVLLGDVEASNNQVDANVISGNTHNGVEILGTEATDNVITNNLIGAAADGQSPFPNGESGIVFSEAHHNTVGPGNTIAYNLVAGVAVIGLDTVGNTITENSIYENADGQIVFYGAPNPLPPRPALTLWNGATVSGSACRECQVEIFANPTAQPAGRIYLDTAMANESGDFVSAIDSVVISEYPCLSATATDAEGTTSPFALGLCAGYFHGYLPLVFKDFTPSNTPTPMPVNPTPTPTITPTPTPITPIPTSTSTPAGWVTILEETFEGDFPGVWTVLDNQDGYGEYYWDKRDCRNYAGSYSGWAVGGGADGGALACGSNYPEYARSWMVYGPFSLTDATAGDLAFKLWLNSELDYDGVFYGASVDGNSFHGPLITGNSEGWIDRMLDLTDVPTLGNLMGQPQVWIAMVFLSDFSNNYPEGAYVDDIVLRKHVSGLGGQ